MHTSLHELLGVLHTTGVQEGFHNRVAHWAYRYELLVRISPFLLECFSQSIHASHRRKGGNFVYVAVSQEV